MVLAKKDLHIGRNIFLEKCVYVKRDGGPTVVIVFKKSTETLSFTNEVSKQSAQMNLV